MKTKALFLFFATIFKLSFAQLTEQKYNLYLAEEIAGFYSGGVTAEGCKKAIPMFKKSEILDGYGAYELALCQYATGEYQEAIYNFTVALNKMTGKLFLRKGIYTGRDSAGDWIVLDSNLIQIKENISAIDIKYYRGICKSRMKDYIGALADFNSINIASLKAIKPEYLQERAECYYNTGKYTLAKLDLDQSLKLRRDSYCYYLRGYCNMMLNMKKNACLDFSKCGEMGYVDAYKLIDEYCNK